MIDTNKLIPQRKEGARLSEKTITTIGFIKKDVVKIDSLLKEKLVLSKARYGILRQQNEREKRFGREKSLESKKSRPQDFGFNMLSNKKRKGFGGFLGGILKSVLGVLGFTIFKSLPGLIRVGAMIKTIAVPFTALVGVAFLTLRTIVNVGRKISTETRGLDPKKINRDAVDKGINNFSTQLVRAAQAFAAGVAGGIIVQRLVKGRTFTEKESIQKLERARQQRKGMSKADSFTSRVSKETGVPFANVKQFIKSGEMVEMIDDVDTLKKGKTIKKKFTTIKSFEDYADYLDAEDALNLEKLEREAGSSAGARTLVEQQSGTPIRDFKPQPKQKIKARSGEKKAQEQILDEFIKTETIKEQKKLADISQVRIDRTVGRRKGIPIDFTNVPDIEEIVDMEEFVRLDREMRGLKPKRISKEAVFGNQSFRAPTIPKKPKINASKLAGKKGLSKLLFNVGGEALEQSVKQVVKQSVSTIPLIGDLIGFLLDVFLFKQPVGRAAFMASGSILGGMIGGILGLIGGPPGVLVGSIIGGIGGDLLGGAFYDLIVGKKSIGVVQQVGESAVKKTIKGAGLPGFTLGGFTGVTGGYTHPMEFVIDRNSTLELERNAPGFLSALNKASGSGVIDVLRSYTSYESTDTGTETFIPLPFEKIVTRTITVGGESRDTDDSTSPFIDLYRRG